MKYEIQNSASINFLIEQPISNVGDRKFYKCKFNESSMKKGSSLHSTDLYYITKDYKETNNGAFLTLIFDENRENLLFFEYLRKPSEDIESIEYAILEFIKRLSYKIKDFKKSENSCKYYNNNNLL